MQKAALPMQKVANLERHKTDQLGGVANYAFIIIDLILAWLGWALVLAGLSALQNKVNKEDDSWAVNANYPALQPHRLLRFDWFILFLNLVVLGLVTLAIVSAVVRQSRSTLVGYLAVATTLAIISTNRVYDISHFASTRGEYHSSRCAFAGWVILDIGNLGLMYLLGLHSEYFSESAA